MRRGIVVAVIALIASGCMKETVKANASPPTSSADRRASSEPAPAAPNTEGKPRHGLLETANGQPEELGAALYLRDLEEGVERSRATGKPIFLLFTEVPGCHTVKSFGNGPLRHPLLVEAIEDEFVPVAIYNNKGGSDREVLKSFGEPAWNNPVVRFVDAQRDDLTNRYASGWSVGGLATAMSKALEASERDVPVYLASLAREETAKRRTTVFSMYCFWTGEVGLAGLDGVVATRPGFAGGREAVEVTWDARQTSLEQLLRAARNAGAASSVVATSKAEQRVAERFFDDVVVDDGFRYSAKDDKYQIRRARWGQVPMTPAQATRANRAAATKGESPGDYLSPRQRALARSDERWDSQAYPPNFRPVAIH